MISLNDTQLTTVMAAASQVPHEKRSQFLQRIAAMLTLRGRGHFTDSDVDDAVQLALVGMVHEKQFARSDLGGDPIGRPVVR